MSESSMATLVHVDGVDDHSAADDRETAYERSATSEHRSSAVPSFLQAVATRPAPVESTARAAETGDVAVLTPNAAASRIARGITLTGDILVRDATEELIVEGTVLGNIYHAGKVVVAESGTVVGNVVASSLLICGRVIGAADEGQGECVVKQFSADGEGTVRTGRVRLAKGQMSWSSTGDLDSQLKSLPLDDAAEEVAKLIVQHDEAVQEKFGEQLRQAAA